MLYVDDAGGDSKSPEQLWKMMGVIAVVCAAFGLTLSEPKTDNVFTREGDAGVYRHFQCRGSGPGVQRDKQVCTTTIPTCPSRSTGACATHGAAFGRTPSNFKTDRALPST